MTFDASRYDFIKSDTYLMFGEIMLDSYVGEIIEDDLEYYKKSVATLLKCSQTTKFDVGDIYFSFRLCFTTISDDGVVPPEEIATFTKYAKYAAELIEKRLSGKCYKKFDFFFQSLSEYESETSEEAREAGISSITGYQLEQKEDEVAYHGVEKPQKGSKPQDYQASNVSNFTLDDDEEDSSEDSSKEETSKKEEIVINQEFIFKIDKSKYSTE